MSFIQSLEYDPFVFPAKSYNELKVLARAQCPMDCPYYAVLKNKKNPCNESAFDRWCSENSSRIRLARQLGTEWIQAADNWEDLALDFMEFYNKLPYRHITQDEMFSFIIDNPGSEYFFFCVAEFVPSAFMIVNNGYRQSLLCNHQLDYCNMWITGKHGFDHHIVGCPNAYVTRRPCVCFDAKREVLTAHEEPSNFWNVVDTVQNSSKSAKFSMSLFYLAHYEVSTSNLTIDDDFIETTTDSDTDDFDEEMVIDDIMEILDKYREGPTWICEARDMYPYLMLHMLREKKWDKCKIYTAVPWKAPRCDLVDKMFYVYRTHIRQTRLPARDECIETVSGVKKDPRVKIRKHIVKTHKFSGLNQTGTNYVISCTKIINRMSPIPRKQVAPKTYNLLNDWVNNRKMFVDFNVGDDDCRLDFGDLHYKIDLSKLPRQHKSIGNVFNIPIKNLPVVFGNKREFEWQGEIASQYDQALIQHYSTNPHHPEYHLNQMTPHATIECMFDLLASAMRLTGNALEAFDRIKTWLYYTDEDGFHTLNKKFEKLHPKGMAWFYIWILRRGLSTQQAKHIISDRSQPLTSVESKLEWNILASIKNISEKRLILEHPKFKGYIRETRQHISIIEYEMSQMRVACHHDRDKMAYQMIVPYVWKWWIPHIETTTGNEEIKDLEPTTSVTPPITLEEKRNVFDKIWTKISLKYNELTNNCNPMNAIVKPLDEMKTGVLDAISKLDGLISDAIVNVMKLIKNFFGYIGSKAPTILSIAELIYAYLIWKNTDNILLKISAFMTCLHALDLFSAFVAALDIVKDMANSYWEDYVETTTGEEDENSMFSRIFECLTDVCPRKAGFLCALLVTLFAGALAMKNKKMPDLGSKVIESMKNIHFVGAGMLGLDRIFRYVCAVVKVALEWVGDNIFGLGKLKEEKKKEMELYSQEVYRWGTALEYYSTSLGIKNIKVSVQHCDRAKKLTVDGFKYLRAMPHTEYPRELDQYIRGKQKILKEVSNLIYRVNTGGAFRHTPFHVQFYGKAGVGKSTLHRKLASKIQKEFYPDMALNRLLYSPMESTANGDDWDNYDSTKKIIIVDEMFKILSPEVITQWLNIISCAPLMVPMAHLEEKGEHFEADWIISNTNVAYPRCNTIASHDAVWRRRHLLIEAIIDNEVFNKVTGKFETALFEAKYNKVFYEKKVSEIKNETWTREKDQKYLNSLHDLLDRYPHLTFNLCNPIPSGNDSDSGLSYLDPECLPNGIIEPTRDLTFDQLWIAIVRRRTVLRDEEERTLNSCGIEQVMKAYDEELLQVVDSLPDSSPLYERIVDHMFVPEEALDDGLIYKDLPREEIKEEEVDSMFEQGTSSAEPVVEKIVDYCRVLNIDGDIYHIYPHDMKIMCNGVNIRWTKQVIDHYNIAYGEKLGQELIGEFNFNIETTTLSDQDMVARRRRLGTARKNCVKIFGVETMKHLLQMSNSLLPYSGIELPTQHSEMPVYCKLDGDTRFIGVEVVGGNTVFNKKYGALGTETFKTINPPCHYNELHSRFYLNSSEQIKYPNWRANKMSMYYLSKIKEIDGDFYYLADMEDTEMVHYLKLKHGLINWVPITILNCIEPFFDTLDQFTTLSRNEKLFVLQNLSYKKRIFSSVCAIRRIASVSHKQVIGVIQKYLWNPIKYVWKTLYFMHDAIVKLAIASMVIVTMSSIGRLFLGNNVETTSKAFVKTPHTVQGRLQYTTVNDVLDSLVSKNLFEINCGSGPGNALGLKDHLFVMNAHALPRGYEDQDQILIKIRRTRISEDWWSVYLPTANMIVVEDKDLVFCNLQTLAPFRDITKHFRTIEDNERHPLTSITLEYVRDRDLVIHDFPVESLQREVTGVKESGASYVARNCLIYLGKPALGSSGGVIYTSNNYCARNIVGIQCARFPKKGIATVLTREDIEGVFKSLGTGIEHQGPFCASDEVITTTTDLITTHINVVGSVPKGKIVGEVFKSDFHKTPIWKYVPESKRIPAKLGNVGIDGLHPLTYSVNKCGRDIVQPLEPKLLMYAVEQMVYDRIERLGPTRILKTLSFDETIRGLYTDGNTAINVKTSPGIPYIWYRTAPGKKSYIEFNELGEITYVSDRLKEDFNMVDQMVRRGVLPPASMYEFPKDELRPVGKHTRSISVCPLVLNLLYRKYNLSYDSEMQMRADGTQEFCVGINPEGRAWTSMHECMAVKSKTGVDLDVKNWDGHFPMDLKNALTIVRNRVYKRLSKDWNENDDLARLTLAEFPIFGHTQFKDLVLQKNRGQSSGWGGTASENTDGHELLSDFILYKLIQLKTGALVTKRALQKHVCKRIYGDDIFYVVADDMKSVLPVNNIARMYENFGWPVTSAAAKDQEIVETDIDSISFLKRRFKKYSYGTYLAALEKSVIYDMLYWQRRSSDPNQFYINIELALRYMFAHGRKSYDELVELINTSLEKIGKPPIAATYYREACYYDYVLFNA